MANKHTYREICIVDHGDHFTVAVASYDLKKREYLTYFKRTYLGTLIKFYFDALWNTFTPVSSNHRDGMEVENDA